jgi:large subunit ribosomal protein L29
MKAKELRERSTEELVALRDTTRREAFQNRMKNHMNGLADTSRLGKARKDIARIELILGERSAQGSQV